MSSNLWDFFIMLGEVFQQVYNFLKQFLLANVPGVNVPVYLLIGGLSIATFIVILILKIIL